VVTKSRLDPEEAVELLVERHPLEIPSVTTISKLTNKRNFIPIFLRVISARHEILGRHLRELFRIPQFVYQESLRRANINKEYRQLEPGRLTKVAWPNGPAVSAFIYAPLEL
jgi:hypothetical protein